MHTCSQCGAETEPGDGLCLLCGAVVSDETASAASAESPGVQAVQAVSEQRIALASFGSAEEARGLRDRLLAAGIDVFDDAEDNAADWFASSGERADVGVFVREADAERARNLLQDPPASSPPPSAAPVSAEPPLTSNLRSLESKLSCLMDDMDVPGWTVNPAFRSEVEAFIEAHSSNPVFVKKARALQENRAHYFTTMRAREAPLAPPRDPFLDTRPNPVETPVTKPELEPPALVETPAPLSESEPPALVAGALDAPAEATSALPEMPAPVGPKSRRKKWLVAALVLIVVVPVGAIVGGSMYLRKVGGERLEQTLAAVDDEDADWRWDALVGQRQAVDDTQNSATLVAELARELPQDWPDSATSLHEMLGYDPTDLFSDEQITTLQAELARYEVVRTRANELTRAGVGRFPTPALEEMLSGPPAYVARLHALSNWLWLDAALLARNRKANDALTRARALLNIGSAIGDDPNLQAQLCRLDCRRLACSSIERALAHGEASALMLQKTQRLLSDEQTQPILLCALRGQRARVHELMTRLENHDDEAIPDRERDFVFALAERGSTLGQAEHWLKYGWLQENHALNLELLTQAVALAKLPLDQQREPFQKLDITVKRLYDNWRTSLARRSLPEVIGTIQTYQRSQVELRCAIIALAVERYRLKHQRWPRSLDQLVPEYVVQVPDDPYDGRPLRYQTFPGGVMIYSIGPDGKDNRGSFDRNDPYLIDRDVGFRLWEVGQRPPPKLVWPPKDEREELLKPDGD